MFKLWQDEGITLGESDGYAEIIRFYTKNSSSFLVGCEKETGEIIGVCMGGFDGRRGYIYHLAVNRNHQGNGYGASLMSEVAEVFKARGVKKVHLFLEKRNSEVEEFYRKNKWTKRDDIMLISKNL